MALTATIYTFDIDLADADRGVYETLALRVARHPSESEEYLVTRLIAYCLEYREGIAFSNGIADPDEPAIAVRDLTGAIQVWIEIGASPSTRIGTRTSSFDSGRASASTAPASSSCIAWTATCSPASSPRSSAGCRSRCR